MKVLKVLEGGLLEIKNIPESLKASQEEVGGLIDIIEINDKIDLVVNDEFLLNGSEPTLFLNNNLIVCGDCFFMNQNGDLTEEQINYLFRKMRRLKNGILVWIGNV
ncbi:protein of unknown function [Peptoniphilus asaccharolyticus DSM 20463]|uniref:DUF3846 domain-containing protein n=1 Tax=Peptoniphilus asaccharolyticus DSM 20463 TaxID=573058 RepID=A0A1W1UZS7_PEPAS|nr:DUF3846 domain-containing protein [Peptoniphilus asaccharolyticus]MBL7575410.1 DUF3846 domain-containing protein [Peptoniphilus asaccharolyticus]SMB86583.1 protein of unknown function [Peptoniphilus asaccharolyticus DSM 20463]